ncbi:histidinol-phosphate transaminase [Bacillus subtilis]|uniref:histidinol-phosphate transaminase n=1 Tax=Bacillus TaxID=1386 RepID=UPI0002A13B7F|nr:histidinol-phosphate transaminase [Bacillus subtilis]AMR46682.1 histidinol-phosphate transaminase [Bacillus subtilis subsp. subtilis]AGA23569.1 Histidinol-phosphate aminotransferase [Bacillus subtilis subsp. subtilis str. BSP1]KMN94233.1 histidinol-phosphate aminotransferase [Bacillus subtilis]MCF7606928.1 histidinol-phosphate transaminase [Bacillus subtilis]MCF7613408.1 histidinol-phosphate transaminase [Bacillus subtilis]
MRIKEHLKQLKPYQPGKPIEAVKSEYGLDKVVKLASNENPYGCSEAAKEALHHEIQQLALYPDGYSAALRTRLSKHLNVSETSLIFGNGSDEIIQIICRAFLNDKTNTVTAAPTFPQYKHNAVIEGAEVREIALRPDGSHDLDAMLEAIDEQTQVVWICSPNNPTGTYTSEGELLAFLERVPSRVLVVLDEAYYEYVTAEDYPETVPLLSKYSNLMILRTFSKAYGLAALRVGYGIADESLIRQIEPAREPFNTSRLGQAAAIAALDDQAFIASCVEQNNAGLQQYYDFAKTHGLKCYPSQTNFVLIDFKRLADELFQALLEKGYIVRSGNALGFPTSLRITIGTKEQNEEILAILAEIL